MTDTKKLTKEYKARLRKSLTQWLNGLDLKDGEGLYLYSTKDRFQLVVHLPDGEYREDKITEPELIISA